MKINELKVSFAMRRPRAKLKRLMLFDSFEFFLVKCSELLRLIYGPGSFVALQIISVLNEWYLN